LNVLHLNPSQTGWLVLNLLTQKVGQAELTIMVNYKKMVLLSADIHPSIYFIATQMAVEAMTFLF